jgi:3-hydroxyacyl-CoA dehydrogenase / enoyl-CoA hydratase / 3-hydroxybutyryl-CoA epimerase
MAPALTIDVRDTVAIVTLDVHGSPVNTLTRAVRDEFVALLDRLERDASIRAAVLLSGKRDVWVAGADVDELAGLPGAEEAQRLSRDGQALMDRVERLRTPVVAAIGGACMGGGLELALACAYRIASDSAKTVLALPEVQLGLIPGAGGTQRLPRLVGLRAALDMILTGKSVRAKRALQTGLVDEMVHPSILRDIAVARARALADGERPPGRSARRRGGGERAQRLMLDDNPVGRAIVLRQAREQTMSKTRGQYPAPLAALDAVAAGYGRGRDYGFGAEARLFGDMAASDVAKQLISLFFAGNALKKDLGVSVPPPAPTPRPIDSIAVLGTGFMGAGIAAVAAQQGVAVRFKDAEHGRVLMGLRAVRDVVRERLDKRQITPRQFGDTMSLVSGTVDYSGFGKIPLVIEAVFEDIDVKQAVIRELESVLPSGAIVASNTSTIPIARLAEASRDPSHVVGMHFFSPVHKMPLLEVIAPPATSREVIATVVAFGKKLGKTVIVVGDSPGFFANRILVPYLAEAGRLLDEGAAIDVVDKALVAFGFPVGPITLLDEVGIDVGGKAGRLIGEAFGPRLALPASLEQVLESGRTGRKGRKGFYLYDERGKKGGVDPTVYELLRTGSRRSVIPEAEMQQRAVLAMVNEAARCIEEGIVRSARDGDVGAVFGIGFPPFRGGPYRYADSIGVAALVRQLESLNDRFSFRFEPADILLDMARRGEKFYGDSSHYSSTSRPTVA